MSLLSFTNPNIHSRFIASHSTVTSWFPPPSHSFNITVVQCNLKSVLPLDLTRQNSTSWVIKRPDVSYPSTVNLHWLYRHARKDIAVPLKCICNDYLSLHFENQQTVFENTLTVLTCKLQNKALKSELTGLSTHNHQMKSCN